MEKQDTKKRKYKIGAPKEDDIYIDQEDVYIFIEVGCQITEKDKETIKEAVSDNINKCIWIAYIDDGEMVDRYSALIGYRTIKRPELGPGNYCDEAETIRYHTEEIYEFIKQGPEIDKNGNYAYLERLKKNAHIPLLEKWTW